MGHLRYFINQPLFLPKTKSLYPNSKIAGGPQAKQGRDWKTSIFLVAFSSFKLKILKYQLSFRPHATVILNLVILLIYILETLKLLLINYFSSLIGGPSNRGCGDSTYHLQRVFTDIVGSETDGLVQAQPEGSEYLLIV